MSLQTKIAFGSGASRPLGNGRAIGRPADPQEIADAVAFLASVEARYMTGAVMNRLGGLDLFVF